MNIRTELLETLIRQCVREVLDQVDERVDADGKPIDTSSNIGKGGAPKKIKPKWLPPSKFKVSVKKTAKINEEEQDEQQPEQAEDPKDKPVEPSPSPGQPAQPQQPEDPQNQPAEPSPAPTSQPEEPNAENPPEPSQTELPPATVKGPVFVNPKDKSKLQPLKLQGRDDPSIERSLHQLATSFAGARTKVSVGAKRMAREAAKNPGASVYFYLGKMDPESDEIFLMADKSLNIAKDDSIQPGDITGAPITTLPPSYKSFGKMTGDEYSDYMNSRNKPTPRYGIDESAKSMIKRLVNQILDGKK